MGIGSQEMKHKSNGKKNPRTHRARSLLKTQSSNKIGECQGQALVRGGGANVHLKRYGSVVECGAENKQKKMKRKGQ
jgi:hypothetical protein